MKRQESFLNVQSALYLRGRKFLQEHVCNVSVDENMAMEIKLHVFSDMIAFSSRGLLLHKVNFLESNIILEKFQCQVKLIVLDVVYVLHFDSQQGAKVLHEKLSTLV